MNCRLRPLHYILRGAGPDAVRSLISPLSRQDQLSPSLYLVPGSQEWSRSRSGEGETSEKEKRKLNKPQPALSCQKAVHMAHRVTPSQKAPRGYLTRLDRAWEPVADVGRITTLHVSSKAQTLLRAAGSEPSSFVPIPLWRIGARLLDSLAEENNVSSTYLGKRLGVDGEECRHMG